MDERRVGRDGPDDVQPCGPSRLDRRRDDVDLFATEEPAFAGVGVQTTDGDPRFRDAELAREIGGDDQQELLDRRLRDRRGNRGERQVCRHQRNAKHAFQRPADQHHHNAPGAGSFRKELGVASERNAGVIEHALLHGCGHHRRKFARRAAGERGIERGHDRLGVRRVRPPRDDGRRDREVRDLQRRRRSASAEAIRREADACAETPGTVAQELDVADQHEARRPGALGQPYAKIRADARGLADGHCDGRSGVHCGEK